MDLEDPELSGAISLLLFNKDLQGFKMDLEDPELSGAISLLILIRNYKESGARRILSSREQFPYCF